MLCFYKIISILFCHYTCQLLDDLLDKFTERICGMLYPEMVNQFGDNFGIGVAFECVSSLLQQSFDLLIICHDTYVQSDHECEESQRTIKRSKSQRHPESLPLWTTTKACSSSERWGWAFTSDGTPWVAHRVWAMPTWHWVSDSKSRLVPVNKYPRFLYAGWVTLSRCTHVFVFLSFHDRPKHRTQLSRNPRECSWHLR